MSRARQMILSWLKTYAAQASLIALGAVSLFAGVQTWRLDSAHGKIAARDKTISGLEEANKSNMKTIGVLRRANAEWSAKCRAEPEKWKSVIADLKKQHELEKENLTNAPVKREVIYREVNDKCHAQPVPVDIAKRLRN